MVESASVLTQEFVQDIPDVINVSLTLPISAGKGGTTDFYFGALMAARDLGNDGLDINLMVFDYGKETISDAVLGTSDVFIGPVECQDIEKVLADLPDGKVLVSPLDHKADRLVCTGRVLQTPTRHSDQMKDLAAWVAEGLSARDRIVVVSENPADTSARVIFDELERLGVPYDKAYGYMTIGNACVPETHTRFITATEKEYLLSGIVRNVSVLALQKQEVSLYCPSKVRSIENLNVELIHNANAHIVTNYFVDYSNPDVKKFIFAYRALFKAEPNSYSFHGYDTMKYFTLICSKYGRDWFKKIEEFKESGLQAGFEFKYEGEGAVNVATNRVVYAPDFSITKQ